MRKLFSIVCLVFITFGILLQPVDAKRFGGGRSFGYQRSASTYAKQPSQIPVQHPTTPLSGASKWLGPLAGLAAGGLLASLFMGKGIGSGILSWLLILGGGLIVWTFIRNRLRPAQPMTVSNNAFTQNVAPFTPVQNTMSHSTPAGFDSDQMLRDAKVQFIRLQTAYDNKNLADIREFTAPEVYAEIQLQLQERGDTHNQTEVVKLDANLLDVTDELQQTIASISFSGLIRENADEPTSFNEIWHFKKLNTESKWLVAGIQQNEF